MDGRYGRCSFCSSSGCLTLIKEVTQVGPLKCVAVVCEQCYHVMFFSAPHMTFEIEAEKFTAKAAQDLEAEAAGTEAEAGESGGDG